MKVLDRILKWKNRDKDTLCDGLTVTNKCIELWVNSIDDKVTKALQNRGTRYDYYKLKDIVWQKEIQPEALRCKTFFEDVRAVIEDPGTTKKLKKVRKNLDIKKIRDIVKLIDEFFAEVSESDSRIFYELRRDPDKVTITEVEDFLNFLLSRINPIKDQVNKLTQHVKWNLECPHLFSSPT